MPGTTSMTFGSRSRLGEIQGEGRIAPLSFLYEVTEHEIFPVLNTKIVVFHSGFIGSFYFDIYHCSYIARRSCTSCVRAIRLERTDPRLAGPPPAHERALAGVYIRAVASPEAAAPRARLSSEAVEHLEALGYLEDGSDVRPE